MNENWNTRKSLLLRASNPDNHAAFEEFVHYYRNFIQIVLARLGVNTEDSKDIEQNLLVKLWKDLSKFDMDREKSNFRGWLSVIIRHDVFRFYKRKNRKLEIDGLAISEETNAADVDQLIESEWKAYIIAITKKKLEEHFDQNAMAVFSFTLDGLSARDIADKLGIKENTVYVTRTRVKAKFQREIQSLRALLEFPSK
ncbi:MAG: RNA polymerase sigma factor [Lentisphaeraceae bacterium]|nr:RNA polymerase sigma factor [Lentisphaeraceae bacterium]